MTPILQSIDPNVKQSENYRNSTEVKACPTSHITFLINFIHEYV